MFPQSPFTSDYIYGALNYLCVVAIRGMLLAVYC